MKGPRRINAHRPLKPGELSRRFRRLRTSLPKASDISGAEPDSWFPETDLHWNPWDLREYSIDHWKLTRTWNELLGGTGATLGERGALVEWAKLPLPPAPEAPPRTSAPRCRWTPAKLPKALAVEVKAFTEPSTMPLSSDRAAAGYDLGVVRELARKVEALPLGKRPVCKGGIVAALHFAEFWVRPPGEFVAKSDSLEDVVREFMEHLFAVHPVSLCVRNVWFTDYEYAMPDLRWIAWFILAGQGASVQRAGPLFGWLATTRMLRRLPEAPAHLSLTNAFIWAEIRALGGGHLEEQRLRENAGFAYSPVWLDNTPPERIPNPPHEFSDFWENTVRWLVKHRESLTDEMCRLILPWAVHCYTCQMHTPQHFSWKGRSLAQARQMAAEYRLSLDLPYPDLQWSGHGRDREWTTDQGETWSMHELLSGEALHCEGSAMAHCVGSYAMRCFQRQSAIFSLRCGDERRLTVEIDPQTLDLRQARGLGNRCPTPEEEAAIFQWQNAERCLAG